MKKFYFLFLFLFLLLPKLTHADLLTGLQAYYKLDETTGTGTASDSSGNGFTLTVDSSADFGTGFINNGGIFINAVHSAMSILNNLNGSTNVSFSFWVKLDNEIGSGCMGFIDHGTVSTFVNFLVDYCYNGGTRRLVFNREQQNVADNNLFYNVNLGTTWHHIVLTYDTSVMHGYLDGSDIGNLSTTGNGTSGVVSDAFLMGQDVDSGAGGRLVGKMDEVGVWNIALTSSDVTSLYNAGTGLTYPFSGGGGSPPPDLNYLSTTTATSTDQLIGSISFGLSIIITLLSIGISGYIFNSITPSKPWH